MSLTMRRGAHTLVFDRIYNFRDVGATINAVCKSRVIKERVLYRSGRLDHASAEDQRKLAQLGIKTVIDLRTNDSGSKDADSLIWVRDNARARSEHKILSEAQAAQQQQLGQSQHKEEEEKKKDAWRTVRINFIGKDFERRLVKELRWWRLAIFGVLMMLKFRMPALRMIGRHVLRPKGLHGMAEDSLKHAQAEILEALDVMSQPESYPILIHCTQGKDRTGLTLTLALLLLDEKRVPLRAIKHDYMLSNEGLLPVRPQMIAEMEAIGMGGEFSMALDSFVEHVRAVLEREYGGVSAYLDGIGFGREKQRRLVKALEA